MSRSDTRTTGIPRPTLIPGTDLADVVVSRSTQPYQVTINNGDAHPDGERDRIHEHRLQRHPGPVPHLRRPNCGRRV